MYEDDPADKWEAFKKFNGSCVPAPSLGFTFDVTPVKTEVAAVKNASEEFCPSLFTGTVDPDEFLPKAIEKFKAAGCDKIIAEMQKQFDEFLENK